VAVIRAAGVLAAVSIAGGLLVGRTDAQLGLLVAIVGIAVAVVIVLLAALARIGNDRRVNSL
jgi:hypothetical protein